LIGIKTPHGPCVVRSGEGMEPLRQQGASALSRQHSSRHFIGVFGYKANRGRCSVEPVSEQVMGDIVNLREARKQVKGEAARRKAAANRLRHGRSKAAREFEAAREIKRRRDLDGHRIEPGDE
jgi:predicted nucleic acid-binding protein